MRFKSNVTSIVIAIIVIHLTATAALSQDEKPDGRKHSLEGGAWAIQFQITDDIGLKPFNGMIVSLKRHFSAHSALRFGVNLDLRYADSTSDRTNTTADTPTSTDVISESRDSESVQFDLMYMNYPNAGATVNWYWGVGPLVRFNRSQQASESHRTYQDHEYRTTSDYKSRSWGVGALGALGVEWFATKGIGFHAEYRASVSYGEGKSEGFSDQGDGRTYLTTSNSDSWVFDGVEVILGVSLYF